MSFADFTVHLLGLSETIHTWHGALLHIGDDRREKIARYAEEIAATFARAALALTTVSKDPSDARASRDAIRELGRITGYIEDIVRTLEDHLDGRKLAGVKRRLDQLAETQPMRVAAHRVDDARIEHLLEAEGYFRALADGLRA
jgi:hypothetical protein